ncbi:uncharacterized protein LOC106175263 [Lingula anatina]|uniref:Uncharacterized protein LOC106175263 n=1 Tax=Lingula anatina TaxID=7574 RepID=A0A1S3JQJ7_LINAN|nr:uncharacterized protein LOC106175263 [Lingula anatina]|eukprot:XP_013412627.1 uncharacterized protein LOC106175263 [Lingula anatina]
MASFVTLSDSIVEENNETKLAQLVQQMIQYCSTSGKPEAVPQNLLLKLITMLNVDYMLSLKTMACALLSLLCHNDPDTKVAVVKKEVLRPIWNTCTHVCRDGLPDLESSSHKRLLQYLEQMVLLLRKLSYGEAYNQFQILKAGLIKLLLQIADMQNLYFYTYHPEAVSFLRNFTKEKDLIGKVSPLVDGEKEEILSQYLKCDSNSILQSASSFVVELYDTTDKTVDVVVKEEMLKRGLAWPEIKPPLNTQKEQNQKISQSEYLVSGDEIKDIPESTDDWLDIRVSHVISPQYFMAYVGGQDTLSTVEQVQKTIAEQVDSKGVKLKKPPEPGQFVCVTLDGMGHCRGQVGDMSDSDKRAHSL